MRNKHILICILSRKSGTIRHLELRRASIELRAYNERSVKDALDVLVVAGELAENVLCVESVDRVEVHEARDERLLAHALRRVVNEQWGTRPRQCPVPQSAITSSST